MNLQNIFYAPCDFPETASDLQEAPNYFLSDHHEALGDLQEVPSDLEAPDYLLMPPSEL